MVSQMIFKSRKKQFYLSFTSVNLDLVRFLSCCWQTQKEGKGRKELKELRGKAQV